MHYADEYDPEPVMDPECPGPAVRCTCGACESQGRIEPGPDCAFFVVPGPEGVRPR